MTYNRDAIRRLMVARGWTEQELATRSGVGPRTINYLARGLTEPKATTLGKLAHAFGVPVGSFFRRSA